jgi:hypothetical protein
MKRGAISILNSNKNHGLGSMMIVRRLLFFLGLCVSQNAFSQSSSQALEAGQDINVLYRHEATFKVFAHTRGFGVGYRRAKHVTAKTKSLLEFEGLSLKHPKEFKVKSTEENAKRFVYGKINSVALLRVGTGLQNVLYKRSDRKSVEIRCSYVIGAVLAIAKPYYVLVYRGTGTKRQPEAVKYDAEQFTQDSVVGKGSFINGLDEIKLYPGIHGKLNLSFEYAPYSNWVRAIETGVSCDYYPKALPIMARNPGENAVVTFYVGFVFGKKWF